MLGTLSSFHCVGMCGPLALALPLQHISGMQKSISLIFYHLGRIAVYACFGLIFGLAGRGIYLAGFQRWFSVGLGILMLFFLVQFIVFKNFPQPFLVRKTYLHIQNLVFRLFYFIGNGEWVTALWHGLPGDCRSIECLQGAIRRTVYGHVRSGYPAAPVRFELFWFHDQVIHPQPDKTNDTGYGGDHGHCPDSPRVEPGNPLYQPFTRHRPDVCCLLSEII
jgi:hypothetical protein